MTTIVDKKKLLIENRIKGYISGFFDAEGTVQQSLENAEPEVSIKQTHFPVLRWISERFPGGIEKLEKKEGNKQAFRWRSIRGDSKIKFLEYIYPSLIEKRQQVGLAIDYLKEVKKERDRSTQFILSNRLKEYRESLKIKLETLKHEELSENELKKCSNELKRMKIPKDIREGRQSTLLPIEELYDELGINNNIEINEKIPKMLEDVFIGYLAGFFDGEGYVGIEKGVRDSYTLFVVNKNTNFGILKLYQDRYEGDIKPDKSIKEHHKPKWRWYVTNSNTLPILKEIYKWTIVKRPQIEEAIKFQEWHNKIGIINTLEKKKIADSYMIKIQELKKYTGEELYKKYANR